MPHFCLGDTNMLVSENAKTPNAKPKICNLPDAKPKRKPVEYRLRWVPTQNSGVGHVHFMFFVLISFALGSQREPSFQWNMGFSLQLYKMKCLLVAYIKNQGEYFPYSQGASPECGQLQGVMALCLLSQNLGSFCA